MFTVRNRPVLFTKGDGRYSESLHAVERGPFPISQSGYRSMAGCLYNWHDDSDIPLDAAITPEILDALAVKQEKELQAALIRAKRSARVRPNGSVSQFITLSSTATCITKYGLFADNKTRREVWHAAYPLFQTICDDNHFSIEKMAGQAPAWHEEGCRVQLALCREQFALLRRFMAGDLRIEDNDHIALTYMGSSLYFDLPPKPEGEPVIEPPSTELEFDFTTDLGAAHDDEGDNDDDEPFDEGECEL